MRAAGGGWSVAGGDRYVVGAGARAARAGLRCSATGRISSRGARPTARLGRGVDRLPRRRTSAPPRSATSATCGSCTRSGRWCRCCSRRCCAEGTRQPAAFARGPSPSSASGAARLHRRRAAEPPLRQRAGRGGARSRAPALLPRVPAAGTACPPALVLAVLLFWGVAVVADSPQFSALSARPARRSWSAARWPSRTASASSSPSLPISLATTLSTLGANVAWLLLPGPVLGLLGMRRLVRRRNSEPAGRP